MSGMSNMRTAGCISCVALMTTQMRPIWPSGDPRFDMPALKHLCCTSGVCYCNFGSSDKHGEENINIRCETGSITDRNSGTLYSLRNFQMEPLPCAVFSLEPPAQDPRDSEITDIGRSRPFYRPRWPLGREEV
jgi:hypothetical protein